MFSRKRLRDYIREHGYKQKVISEKLAFRKTHCPTFWMESGNVK